MKIPRLYVDFNEMVEENLVLLSDSDFKADSEGRLIRLEEGLKVNIYSHDIDENGNEDNLVAEGVVELTELNNLGGWPTKGKWSCRINENGICHESDFFT